jgi:glutathione peroxidase
MRKRILEMSALSNIEFKANGGKTTKLADYGGQVILIVNVASKCGLTPQYEGLEKMFEKYQDQGFTILGFPANEFAGQEPGSNAEIQAFCSMNFGVKFPVLEKVVVKGEGQHSLFKTLTTMRPQATQKTDGTLQKRLAEKGLLTGQPEDIKWNFEKFLLNRRGEVVGRFAPDITPEDPVLIQAVETELANRAQALS